MELGYDNSYMDPAMAGILIVFYVLYILFCLVIGIISIISLWKLFNKANEPGWAAIIPFYNMYVMLRIGKKPDYWLLLLIIPFVNIAYYIMTLQGFLKAYGRGDTVSVLLAFFLSPIYFPYLAFSKNVQYIGHA
jgi:hypothetical protein